jgi:hypothetical protein
MLENIFEEFLLPISIMVVLPLGIVWIVNRRKMLEMTQRMGLARLALEKNVDLDLSEFLKNLNAPARTLRERILAKLQNGLGMTLAGVGMLAAGAYMMYMNPAERDYIPFLILSLIFLPIGIGFLAFYFKGKNLLQSEPEEPSAESLEQASEEGQHSLETSKQQDEE